MTTATPWGVVAFLFIDIAGSTRRWDTDAKEMRTAIAAHDDLMWKQLPQNEVRDERWHVNEIERSAADNLVGDVHLARRACANC